MDVIALFQIPHLQPLINMYVYVIMHSHLLYFLWCSTERDGSASSVETSGQVLVLLSGTLGIHVGTTHALYISLGSGLVDRLQVHTKTVIQISKLDTQAHTCMTGSHSHNTTNMYMYILMMDTCTQNCTCTMYMHVHAIPYF